MVANITANPHQPLLPPYFCHGVVGGEEAKQPALSRGELCSLINASLYNPYSSFVPVKAEEVRQDGWRR